MPRFNTSDNLNFITKLTVRRLWNACKVHASFHISRWINRPVIWGYPMSMSIEPTTACNLSCPECPSGLKSFTRATGTIRQDHFRETIDAVYKDLVFLNFYFQGEPYLHKGFLDMVQYASDKGIYTATSTNAHFLDDAAAQKTITSGLDRLIISLDGTTQEVYEQYRRGGNLNKVLDGAKNIVRWKKSMRSKTPMVVFQFLVVKPNQHQLEDAKKMAREIGVDDIWFKSAQVYDYQTDPNALITDIDQYSRYKKNHAGETVPKNKLQNHCWKMWQSNVVTWDGKVVPCCFDKDAEHVLGDLKQKSMKEIWDGKEYNEFRASLMKSRKNIDICANCSEGLTVWS